MRVSHETSTCFHTDHVQGKNIDVEFILCDGLVIAQNRHIFLPHKFLLSGYYDKYSQEKIIVIVILLTQYNYWILAYVLLVQRKSKEV